MAVPGGQGLGNAVGTVTIQANLAQAENQINQFVQNTTNVFNSLNQQTNNVANSFTRMTTVVRGIGAAFGIGFGAHTIQQLAKMAVEANDVAVAYERQMVAAEDLAGGQARLNTLMESYADATGHILSESDQLADVTKLMAVGFADSALEIDKFATAIRGISVAMGSTQHSVTQNLILELFSQRGARLDQLGLQYDKVKVRVTELMEADRTMTKQAAYQQAVLEQAIQRYGALGESAEGAATGFEKAAKAAKDAQLEIGKVLQLPFDVAGTAFAMYIANQISLLQGYEMAWDDLYAAMQRAVGVNVPTGMQQRWIESRSATDAGRHPRGPRADPTENPDITQAKEDWFRETQEIEDRAGQQRVQSSQRYAEARNDAINQYEQDLVDAAADFAKQRTRAEEDYAQAVADVHEEAFRREEKAARDHAQDIARMQEDAARTQAERQATLDRTIGDKRADSAEKIADMGEDRDRQIADRREASADRLAEMEEDYARDREEAERDHQLTLAEAADSNDAKAMFMEQRRWQEENRKAAEAHEDKVEDEKEKLDEAIENINEAYERKVADEKEALEKSIKQQNDSFARANTDAAAALQRRIDDANTAYAQQLADAKAADAQRLLDMGEDFAARVTRENEDHTDRMTRMGTDHTARMGEMDREHRLDMAQITQHEWENRRKLDEEFEETLADLGMQSRQYAAQKMKEAGELNKAFDLFWEHLRTTVDPNAPVKTPSALQALIDQGYIDLEGLQAQQGALPDSAFGGAEWNRLQGLIDDLLTQIEGWEEEQRNNQDDEVPVAQSNVEWVGKTVNIPEGATLVGGGGKNLNVTFAQGSIIVNGAVGQSVEGLASIIDQRILNVVTAAARRM